MLTVGVDDWPMPVPLLKTGVRWSFDAAAGREEVLARRIGRNELDTIQVLKAMVERPDRVRTRGLGSEPGQPAYGAEVRAAAPARRTVSIGR